MKKGERYEIIDEEDDEWTLLKDKNGNSGYAPAGYLKVEAIEEQNKSHYEKEYYYLNKAYFFIKI